ncbi:MFS transporter [Thalassococcus sp. S3]|uniref:MFS transporter n=1 Tax=Thalassococcus sp. S3 TaxID=2017482 RepID=UPI001023F491|nr:MFS transporter [Thalassococcus sp. S3]QBF31578.1 MFS transporter [Thalassococcus sp. S3]
MRRDILLLLLAIGVIGANSLLLSPVVAAVAADFGTTPRQVMTAASAYGLGTALSALTLAPLSDRFGAGRVLRIALVALALGLASSALAPSPGGLIGAQTLCGLAAGAALPAIYTLAAEIAPEGRTAQTVGAVLTGWTVALVFGVSAAAWLTDLAGWRVVYVTFALLTGLLWATSSGLSRQSRPSGVITSPLTALRVPGISRGLLATGLVMFSFYVTYFFVGAQVTLRLDLSTTKAGLVPLAYGLGFGLAVYADRWIDRLGLARATPLLFVYSAIVYVVMAAVADSYVALLVMALLWGIGQHLCLNLVVARLSTLEPTQRGAIMGLYSAVTYLAVFAAPLAGAPLFAAFGLAGCLIVSALLSLAEAVESLGLRRVRTQRSA